VPTTVSTVLVPTKNAASWPAGTDEPVTGSKQAARIAAPVPTLAGENGTSRPLHCANVTSSTAANVAGRWNAAKKQPSARIRATRLANCQGRT